MNSHESEAGFAGESPPPLSNPPQTALTPTETKKSKRCRPNKHQRRSIRDRKGPPPTLTEELVELVLVYAARHATRERLRTTLNVICSMQPRTLFRLAFKRTHMPSPMDCTKKGGKYLKNLDFCLELDRELVELADRRALTLASKYGRVDSLDWWVHKYSGFGYLLQPEGARAVVIASRYGHVHVLEWWRLLGLQMDVEKVEAAIEDACKTGKVDVLQWWWEKSRSGIPAGVRVPFVYKSKAVSLACAKGHVNVLEWWKARSRWGGSSDDNDDDDDTLDFRFTHLALDLASKYSQLDVLDWWIDSGIKPLKYGPAALKWASERGHVAVLDWWLAHATDPGCPQVPAVKINDYVRHRAGGKWHPLVREWWDASGIVRDGQQIGAGKVDWDSKRKRMSRRRRKLKVQRKYVRRAMDRITRMVEERNRIFEASYRPPSYSSVHGHVICLKYQ